jgi:hypothetical protein
MGTFKILGGNYIKKIAAPWKRGVCADQVKPIKNPSFIENDSARGNQSERPMTSDGGKPAASSGDR